MQPGWKDRTVQPIRRLSATRKSYPHRAAAGHRLPVHRTRLWTSTLNAEVRELIATIGRQNPHWGTERIRGELLKLGLAVSARSIRRYRRRGPARPPSQSWRRRRCGADFALGGDYGRQTAGGGLVPLLPHPGVGGPGVEASAARCDDACPGRARTPPR